MDEDGEAGADLLPRIAYSPLYENSHPDSVASRSLPISIFPEYPAAVDPVPSSAASDIEMGDAAAEGAGVGPMLKRGRVGQSKVTCGHCHEVGHNARGCPVKKNRAVGETGKQEARDAE